MPSEDFDARRLGELDRLADRGAAPAEIEDCPALLGWLPGVRVPEPDTPARRARAVHGLFRELVAAAQAGHEADDGDAGARETLAVGALFGLVTWGPGEHPDPGRAPAANLTVRRALAGSWLSPPIAAETLRRPRTKQRLLAAFRHTLDDHVPEGRAPLGPVPAPRPVRRRWPAAAAAAVLLAAAGGLYAWQPWHREPSARAVSARVEDRGVDEENRASTGAPVEVVSVTPVPSDAMSWALAEGRALSAAELREIGGSGDSGPSEDWFRRNDAVPVGGRQDRVVLQGNSERTVRVVDLAVDKTCRAPLTGTLFESPGAGQDDTVVLLADLDQRVTVVRDGRPEAYGEDYFAAHSLSLRPGEQIVVVVQAFTERHYCEYALDFTVLDGARRLTQTVMDDGRPFRVTATAVNEERTHPYEAYQRVYAGGLSSHYLCGDGSFVPLDPKRYTSDPPECL
ncbi:hypothetical protein ACFVDH_04350 [Streptomyces sp. NPDC057674]|uniref:hypothetical protein n=1 Tax=Streptomyces sp. NPDC057674 TaxID=3346203 RepID=UPI0036A05735